MINSENLEINFSLSHTYKFQWGYSAMNYFVTVGSNLFNLFCFETQSGLKQSMWKWKNILLSNIDILIAHALVIDLDKILILKSDWIHITSRREPETLQ